MRVSFLRRILARWRSRHYRSVEHMDCIAFHGPCDECRQFLLGRGVDPDVIRPLSETFPGMFTTTFRLTDGKISVGEHED